MLKSYNEDARVAKNRRSAVKDMIEQYERSYRELRNAKTPKDPFAEICNRNDVGNLHFVAGTHGKAQECWEEAIAAIFRTARPIENYLEVCKPRTTMLVTDVGWRETILSLTLLYKIAKFGAYHKLYYQYNCTKFAIRLTCALFETDLRHPQSLLGHARYRLKGLTEKDFLGEEPTISLSELVSCLEYFSLRSIDMGNAIQSLPLLSLYEHLSTDILKHSELAITAKLTKCLALASSGLISESIGCLAKVVNEKDLPNVWIEASDRLKREKGENWQFGEVAFDNTKPWSEGGNKEAVEWVRKATLKADFVEKYGLLSAVMVAYLRGLILAKIFLYEFYDSAENSETKHCNM
jgi:hypothetical protein